MRAQLLRGGEQRRLAEQNVQDEAFVGFGDSSVKEWP